MRRKNKADEQRKARQSRGATLEAPARTRTEKPTILIVCDGKNTEPSYFNQFRLRTARIKSVGEGNNTISSVRQAIELRDAGDYDQVWVVFDRDEFPSQNFHDAIQLAEREGIGLAWSNQSFEYWLLLHFDDHQGGGMHRNQYGNRINKLIEPLGASYDYDGSKLVDSQFFMLLESLDPKTRRPRREIAIDRAKRIRDHWQGHTPAESESCTLVFQLVEEIIKYV